MSAPSPNVVRPVVVVALLGIALVHVITLPAAFEIGSYLGVAIIIAIAMAAVCAVLLLVTDRNGVWIFAVAEGALNAVGYVLSRSSGMPFDRMDVGRWHAPEGISLAFLGVTVAVLAGWVLVARRIAATGLEDTLAVARERALMSAYGGEAPDRPRSSQVLGLGDRIDGES